MPAKKQKSLNSKTIVHIVTGSIAAYKAGDLVQALREEGARVICVLTACAKHFVTPLTLRALSGEAVYSDFFSAETPYGVIHTSLAEEADLVLIAPASANFIARLAAGLADDLASTIVLAADSPVVLVPAMNDHMLAHPLTQRNLKTLRDIGYHIVEPIVGSLVCGKEALGHIAGHADILLKASQLLKK
jgi:phosphopantothenoylcysteine synthetase/decarboxylase